MDKSRILLLSILLRLISFLPLVVIQQLGHLLGVLLWYSSSRMAKITRENIQLCFPHLDTTAQLKLARRSLEETGKNILEAAHAWMAPLDQCLLEFVAIEGKEHVERAVGAQRGVIFVIPHLGNWEMLNLYLGRYYPLTHMYQPSASPHLSDAILTWRQRTGTQFVPVSFAGVRSQYASLRSGHSIGAMPDQEPAQHSGIFTTFFGQTAMTGNLLPGLCRRSEASMIVVYAQRLPTGEGFRLVFQPVETSISGDNEAGIDAQRISEAIEKAVISVPEQYLWSYKRFRTRPEGDPEYYQLKGHPISVFVQAAILKSLLWLCSLPTLSLNQKVGAWLGYLAWQLKTSAARITRINVQLCFDSYRVTERNALCRDSMAEMGKALLETGQIWNAGDSEFQQMVTEISGEDLLASAKSNGQGVIVLIPPLGNREVTAVYLGSHYRVTEYYHPTKNSALDELIRRTRSRMGIALLPHTDRSVHLLIDRLKDGQLVTLCPDQQSRLSGGLFVPFFGVDALTTKVLPRLLQQSNALLIWACTERLPEGRGFRLRFSELDCCSSHSEEEILRAVGLSFQSCIETNPAQYRWADKRFNIRPTGQAKVYST
jgi:KDO2-lipid IV(A) lauroyltransferase